MNKKKSLLVCIYFLILTLIIPSVLAVDISPSTPLIVSHDDYTETLAGTGSATVEFGELKSFTLTGTYVKEYDEKFIIGPYSIEGKSRNKDVRIEITNANVTIDKNSYSIAGSAKVYKRNYGLGGQLLLGINDPKLDITYSLLWSGDNLVITNSTKESLSTAAYITITGTNPKIIKTNTFVTLEKDNVGEYEKVYEQEDGTVTIDSRFEITTNSTNNKIHFSTLTLNDDKTITWNKKTTPLTKATTPTLTLEKTKNGITITNGKKTITYYTNKKEYDSIVQDANKKGKYYMC